MSGELTDCPFCGGEASITIHDYFDGTRLYTPKCKCGAGIVGVFRIEADAIKAWNTRAERTCVNEFPGTSLLICSECHTLSDTEHPAKYCPNCGARVVSEEEQGHMVADAIRRLEKAVKA